MAAAEFHEAYNAEQVRALVGELARTVAARHPDLREVALVGIRTGGEHLAMRLRAALAGLGQPVPDTGVMDITLYRDDWTRLHSRPKVGPSHIDFPINDRVVILVDDVLYTGRTVRAALDALIDFGRPRRIELLVLIDRGERELPIQPDYVGARLAAGGGRVVDVELAEQGAATDRVVIRSR